MKTKFIPTLIFILVLVVIACVVETDASTNNINNIEKEIESNNIWKNHADTITIYGCQFLTWGNWRYDSGRILHRPNCSNPIHYKCPCK